MVFKRTRPVKERFEEKYQEVTETGCWIWTRSCNAAGYGQMAMPGRPQLAHRVSWELHRGKIPERTHVLHKCDTPACVNPDHLFLGTDWDNVQDMHRKGRAKKNGKPGASHHMAKLSEEKVLEIFRAEGSQSAIAKRFNVGWSTVNHIKSGRQWSTVTGLPKKT